MIIKKKPRRKSKSLYPVLYVIGSLKDYHHELVQSEVSSLWELSMVSKSFGNVLRESENFKDTLRGFGETFSNINTVSGQFAAVKDNISQSVIQAQGEIEQLKYSSLQVETHFEEMQNTFEEFQRALREIKGCMGKIVSIADQTNILAVNASIEAARAGEEGRGFAVVADEVRKLAEKTMVATKEVGDAVGAIQSGTRDSIAGMTGAREAVLKSNELAAQAGEALERIVGLVAGCTDQVRAIAAASEEQSAASEEINRGTEEINRIAAETADTTRKSAETLTVLAEQSRRLAEMVEQFKKG